MTDIHIIISIIIVVFALNALLFTPLWFGLLEWFWDKQYDLIREMRRPKEPK